MLDSWRAKGLELIGEFVLDLMKTELEEQGHRATGKLIDSMTYKINGDSIEFYAEDYAKFVDSGRKKGARKVPIDALIAWIEQKGIASGDTEVKKVAYAIQTAIFKEGSPTVLSLEHSKNGRRKDFIKFAVTENEKIILQKVVEIFDKTVKTEFINEMVNIRKQWQQRT